MMKVKKSLDVPVGAVRKKGFMFYLKRDWQLYALLLLPMLFILVFKFLPMIGLSLAFMDYNIFTGEGEIVGFAVFKKIFAMPEFREALRNTLLLNGLDLVVGFPAPIILAIFLNEIRCR